MINKTKYLVYFLILVLFANCSFDTKTGIWEGSKVEKERIAELKKEQNRKSNFIKIYSSDDFFAEEIPATKTINLTQPKKNPIWGMPGLNHQNFFGNLYLSGIENKFLKKKAGTNFFSIFKTMSSPLVFGNSIIYSDDTGAIYNISQRGKIIWKQNIYKKLYRKMYKNLTFSIHDNKIYIADNIGFIYAISFENGELIWIKNHGIPLKSNLKIFDNKIYLINQDNRILCLDINNGTKIWDIRSVSAFIKSQNFLPLAITKEGDLVTLNSVGDLLKINTNNGKIYWSFNATGSIYSQGEEFFKSSDIVISGNDIIFSASSSIFSFDLSKGFFNWKKNIISQNIPIIDGNNVFLVSDNGYFVNIDKKSGKIIWSTNILKILKVKWRSTKITGFILGSGKIYVTTLNGFLIICSATSGKVEYFKKIGDSITSSPVISNGSLYILTKNTTRILGYN